MSLLHTTVLPSGHTSSMLHITTVYEWKCGSFVHCFPLALSHLISFLKNTKRCCWSWSLWVVFSQIYWVTWKGSAIEPQSLESLLVGHHYVWYFRHTLCHITISMSSSPGENAKQMTDQASYFYLAYRIKKYKDT